MGKEQICPHFKKDKDTGKSPCGFAQWLQDKPTSLMTVPEKGCGRNEIDKCPRITSPNNFPLNEYGPNNDTELRTAFPIIRKNSKGVDKRLPGGIHR